MLRKAQALTLKGTSPCFESRKTLFRKAQAHVSNGTNPYFERHKPTFQMAQARASKGTMPCVLMASEAPLRLRIARTRASIGVPRCGDNSISRPTYGIRRSELQAVRVRNASQFGSIGRE